MLIYIVYNKTEERRVIMKPCPYAVKVFIGIQDGGTIAGGIIIIGGD
jgi:hypothetical protein